MTIGEKLKDTRKDKNLSLDDIEKMTKIRKKYLKAIEEENYEVIPGGVYVKSFIRTYGNTLDLNGEKLAKEYESRLVEQKQLLEEKQEEEEKSSFFKRHRNLIIISMILLLIFGIISFYLFFSESNTLQIIGIKIKNFFNLESDFSYLELIKDIFDFNFKNNDGDANTYKFIIEGSTWEKSII